ncbi:hypothetical protein HHI36_010896 [Cryptolaemus montrouzieri]|uniref:Uncharacterized protein n=1 Tax=Cryptolaemus montrouzieri TaxID=559131 RepID=A0ABD2MK74_9CUCU
MFQFIGLNCFFLLLLLEMSVGQLLKIQQNGLTICRSFADYPIMFTPVTAEEFIAYTKNKSQENTDYPTPYYLCDLGDDKTCDAWWLVDGWTTENSIENQMSEVITDERWENFEPIHLSGPNQDSKFVFRRILSLKMKSLKFPCPGMCQGI